MNLKKFETNAFNNKLRVLFFFAANIVIAVFGLLGYIPGFRIFGSLREEYIPMAPSTAISFILLSTILILYQKKKFEGRDRFFALSCTLFITVFGFIKLIEYFIVPGRSFEEFIVKTGATLGDIPIGIMSPSTGGVFFICGIAMCFLFSLGSGKRDDRFLGHCAGFLGLSVILLSFSFILAYLYGHPFLYGQGTVVPMAITTAFSFLLFGIGQISILDEEFFPVMLISGTSIRSQLLRIFLPIVLSVFFFGDFLNHFSFKRDFIYDNALISAFSMIGLAAVTTIIVFWFASSFGDALEASQQEVKRREERYHDLYENVPIGICRATKDGRFISVNEALVQVLGYGTKEELMAVSASEIWGKKERREHMLNLLKQKRGVIGYECVALRKGGSEIILSMDVKATFNGQGDIIFLDSYSQDITQRKQVEKSLVLEKKILDDIISSLPGVFYIFNEEACLVRWNKKFEEVLGYSSKEMEYRHATSFFQEEDKALIASRVEKVFSDGMANVEAPIVKKNGEKMMYFFNGVRTMLDGRLYFMGVGIDITERKQKEAELQKSKDLLSQALQAAQAGAWEWNIATGETIWSEENYFVMGVSPDIGPTNYDTWLQCVHPKDQAKASCMVSKAVTEKGDLNFEYRAVWPDGTIRWINDVGKTVFDKEGKPAGMYGIQIDITERKKAEEEMRFHSEVMKNIDEGIYLIGLDDGIIKYANSKFERMFGYDSGEMIGREVSTVNAPTDKTPKEIKEQVVDVLVRKGEWHGEIENIKKDGTRFWCYVSASLFDHPAFGKIIVSFHSDITERKKREEELKQTLQEKDVLLKEVHHRVKNNMMILYGLMNLQQGALSGKENIREILESVKQRIRTMGKIHEMLYRSRNLSEIKLSDYVEYIVSEIVKTFNIGKREISVVVNVDPVKVDIDAALPCGLIINELLTNAFKHAFLSRKRGQIAVSLKQKKGAWELIIKDDGIGMPEGFKFGEKQSLGLRLVSMLAQQVGGEIIYMKTRKWAIFSVIFQKFLCSDDEKK